MDTQEQILTNDLREKLKTVMQKEMKVQRRRINVILVSIYSKRISKEINL